MLDVSLPVTELELAGSSTAPRVTVCDIEDEIRSEHYFTAADAFDGRKEFIPPPLQLLTFCVLVLRNGFTVTGQSACADPANYNPEIGMRIARQKAVDQLYPLLGFRLRDELHFKDIEKEMHQALNLAPTE